MCDMLLCETYFAFNDAMRGEPVPISFWLRFDAADFQKEWEESADSDQLNRILLMCNEDMVIDYVLCKDPKLLNYGRDEIWTDIYNGYLMGSVEEIRAVVPVVDKELIRETLLMAVRGEFERAEM